MKRAAIVLCGGRSSRMGRAKAWLPWFGGRVMLQHVVERLAPVVDEILVVSSSDLALPRLSPEPSPRSFSGLRAEVRVVIDRESARGPLAGLRDGLQAMRAEQAFVTSTDAPFLTPEWVEELFERSRGGAVAPRADGHVQVLSAVYPRAAGPRAEALLAQDVRRPLSLLESLGYAALELEVDPSRAAWRGFNRPDEYLSAVRELDPQASAEIEWSVADAAAQPRQRQRVPVGTLEQGLARLPASLGRVDAETLAAHVQVRLASGETATQGTIPIGPDERLCVRVGAEGDSPRGESTP